MSGNRDLAPPDLARKSTNGFGLGTRNKIAKDLGSVRAPPISIILPIRFLAATCGATGRQWTFLLIAEGPW
jgi:hypothetical protein